MNMKSGDSITKEKLEKLVDLEIQWLKYYSTRESKNKLNESSNIYEDLVSIGWTKRVMKLELRCCPCIITSDEIIIENFDLSKLKVDSTVRGYNRYTPLETYIKIFPEEKIEIINKLK
jgi:hypothetical protein